jgi:hypothetical protein
MRSRVSARPIDPQVSELYEPILLGNRWHVNCTPNRTNGRKS